MQNRDMKSEKLNKSEFMLKTRAGICLWGMKTFEFWAHLQIYVFVLSLNSSIVILKYS